MKGFLDSVAFFLAPGNSALFEFHRWRIESLQHHITDFVVGPDNVSRRGIGVERAPGSAGDVFDSLPFFLVREWKPRFAKCKQFFRLGRFDFVIGITRLLKES